MSLVVAIDVGIRNIGLCVFDYTSNQVVHWERTELTKGKYIPSQNVVYVRDFVLRYKHFFEDSCMVLVERQMRTNMRIIEALFQQIFFDRCIVISPRSVKAHYGLSFRDYRANKQAAIDWADAFVKANPTVFKCSLISDQKRDDTADALLLTMYYLDTYSNQQWDA